MPQKIHGFSESEAYASQNRGTTEAYEAYYAGMDKTAQGKRAAASVHLPTGPGKKIADMGMGSGKASYLQAALDASTEIIGVDINPTAVDHARGAYVLPNLSFRQGDIEQALFPDESLSGILNSSSLHHVHSFNGYDKGRVRNALANQVRQLEPEGVLVIRDFVIPDEGLVTFELSDPSDAELLIRFSKTARSLAKKADQGFFLEELDCPGNCRRFLVEARHAAEFALRKDYQSDWDTEILEEYGYFTQSEFERAFEEEGLRVVLSKPFRNPWIVRNRFRGKFRVFRPSGEEVDFFATNYVIVWQKMSKTSGVRLREKSPVALTDEGYLTFSCHRDLVTGQSFDLVRRKGKVADLFPYSVRDGRAFLLMKTEAPRPMLNVVGRGSLNIDAANYSGYVTEPISVAAEVAELSKKTSERLREAIGFPQTANEADEGPSYYPSPGGTDELVVSKFFKIDQVPEGRSLSAWGNFTSGGKTKLMDVQELLRVAQTGGLPEARAELWAYALLRRLNIQPDPWIGDDIPVSTGKPKTVALLRELFRPETEKRFESVKWTAGFLRHVRSEFVEERREGGVLEAVASNEIDFVIPKTLSTNTASIIPVLRDGTGEMVVAVEKRFLPVCELHEGSAGIVTVPAFRLPKNIDSFLKIERFLSDRFRADDSNLAPLGEAFFPSMGITPEKIYPYVVSGTEMQLPENIAFVPLRELFANVEKLRDLQLIVSIFRLTHALGLWKEFTTRN